MPRDPLNHRLSQEEQSSHSSSHTDDVRGSRSERLTEWMAHFPDSPKGFRFPRLSEQEAKDIKEHIFHFVEDHPVRADHSTHLRVQDSRSLWESLISHFFPLRSMASIVLIISLFLGLGGVSYAAQSALPGDALYTVKVHVNEPVERTLQFSTINRAHFDASIASERLHEGETLAANGKLTNTVNSQISADFAEEMQRVHDAIATLQARGDAKAAAHMSAETQGILEGHKILLNGVLSLKTVNAAHVRALLKIVQDENNETDTARTAAEAKVSTQTDDSAQADMRTELADASAELSAMRRNLKESSHLAVGVSAHAEGQLKIAEQHFLQAQSQFEAKTYDSAFVSANAAQRALGQVKLLLTTQIPIHSEVSVQEDTSAEDDAGSGTSASHDRQDDDASTSAAMDGGARTEDSTSVESGGNQGSSRSSQEGGDAHVGVEGRADADTDVHVKAQSTLKVKLGL